MDKSKLRNRAQLALVSAEAGHAPRSPSSSRRHLTVAGLFAGIGGLELGLSRAGHATDLLCEIEPGANEVLRTRFPDIPKHDDVCTLDRLPTSTELLCGGFPCQDLSQAGKTAGIAGSRSGLVGEVFRLLERQRVPLVLLENVPFMLQLGKGRALSVIVEAFERLGYKWAYRVVDSRAFGLPQRRERVFFLAALDEDPRKVLFADDAGVPSRSDDPKRVACGFYWTEGVRGLGWAINAVPTLKGGSTIGIPSPPAILLPSGDIVKPDLRDAERMQGFPRDWTKPSERVTRKGHRWKLVGNAITVDVAKWLGDRLAAPGSYDGAFDRPLVRKGAWPRAAWSLGNGHFESSISAWPSHKESEPLTSFLKFPVEPLSVKATAGFLSRARTGSLRFPPGFLDAVEAHLERMNAAMSA